VENPELKRSEGNDWMPLLRPHGQPSLVKWSSGQFSSLADGSHTTIVHHTARRFYWKKR